MFYLTPFKKLKNQIKSMKINKTATISAIGAAMAISISFAFQHNVKLEETRNKIKLVSQPMEDPKLSKLPKLLQKANKGFWIYQLPQMKFCNDPIQMTGCY